MNVTDIFFKKIAIYWLVKVKILFYKVRKMCPKGSADTHRCVRTGTAKDCMTFNAMINVN